ncbi:MAG TPA: ABC transporter permease [Xanthobacteraceae bacterium]|jgi:NitT/TauT family transport system permease protein
MSRTTERIAPWVTAALMLILWWLVVVAFRIESFVLPSPVESVTALYQYRYPLAINGFATLATTLAGFALAVAFGLALGIIVGSFRLAYAALYPILIAFNSVPKAALVPILVIWFGVGTVPAVMTAFMLSFFPVVVNVATGFATIEPELLDVMRALGASRWDMVLKIGMPRSLPYFFASLKIAITLSFVGTVIAEIVAGNNGIGNVMLIAGSNFNVPLVFAALLVVGAMGIGMYAIFAALETRFAGWSVRGGGIEFAAGG